MEHARGRERDGKGLPLELARESLLRLPAAHLAALQDGLAQNGDFIKVGGVVHAPVTQYCTDKSTSARAYLLPPTTQVAPEVLEWEARMPLIVSELEEADADIICVQELNKYGEWSPVALVGTCSLHQYALKNFIIHAYHELNPLAEELQQHLASRGYQGCFLPKHCSPAARYHCSPDGLAIFHRTDRFEPVSQWHGERGDAS